MSPTLHWGLPAAASTFAPVIDHALWHVQASMAVIFGVWAVVFVYYLVRYRARPGRRAERPRMSDWWLYIPLILIFSDEIYMMARDIPIWEHMRMELPAAGTSNEIEVVAEQFAWNIHYAGPDGKFGRTGAQFIDPGNTLGLDPQDPAGKDDIVTINELHVPLGKPTVIELTSKDVIHSFFIPAFRVKQDAVPGLRVPLWFEPTLAGTYELACAQLCGVGHSQMRADVIVQTPADYAAWLAGQAKR